MGDFPEKPPETWIKLYGLMLEGSVGDKIVDEVNKFAKRKNILDIFMKVNIESVERVYGLVLNGIKVPKLSEENEWKLVKVGMTGKPTKIGTNNRMEQLMSEISAKSCVFFKLPKAFCDANSNTF